MYINRTIKCLKRLQKRSIDDNLRQLVLILKTRSCACKLKCLLLYKWFWNFFFFLFQKNGSVGRWETKHFMGMASIKVNMAIRWTLLIILYPPVYSIIKTHISFQRLLFSLFISHCRKNNGKIKFTYRPVLLK